MAQTPLDVIPAPAEAVRLDGCLSFERTEADTPRVTGPARAALDVLAPRLGSGCSSLRTRTVPPDDLRGPDGYMLTVDDAGIVLCAATSEGFLYGAQTLRQLLPPPCERAAGVVPVTIPAVKIDDAPRFAWRGLHVDVVRHFFPIDDLKRLVDTMAFHKLNRLHVHLTDDQGWRLEIKSHPRLTDVGAWRAESPRRGARTEGDGTRYGGFYTHDDVRDLVSHAAALGVVVVPEIEMPGHAQAALAAYPELGHGEAADVWTRWGISERIFNVREQTFQFIDDVLTEVASLFPGAWIHLGGDEVPTAEWASSADAAARIEAEGLSGSPELHAWFLGRAAASVARLGRRAVCWDEVLEGGAPPDVVVMAWRDAEHALTAARRGHDVVLCPMPFCYFDHYQGPPDAEPEAIGGHTDLRKVLSFDPLAGNPGPAERRHLLGVQGNLWSEYIPDAAHLEYMAWPRASALAEVAWSPEGPRDADGFEARWRTMAARLDVLGVTYRAIDR